MTVLRPLLSPIPWTPLRISSHAVRCCACCCICCHPCSALLLQRQKTIKTGGIPTLKE